MSNSLKRENVIGGSRKDGEQIKGIFIIRRQIVKTLIVPSQYRRNGRLSFLGNGGGVAKPETVLSQPGKVREIHGVYVSVLVHDRLGRELVKDQEKHTRLGIQVRRAHVRITVPLRKHQAGLQDEGYGKDKRYDRKTCQENSYRSEFVITQTRYRAYHKTYDNDGGTRQGSNSLECGHG